ncbi:hypothetical protein LEMLEM_LOCUS16322 [Lemmus lemmus]
MGSTQQGMGKDVRTPRGNLSSALCVTAVTWDALWTCPCLSLST